MNRTTRTQLVGIEFHWIQFRWAVIVVLCMACCSCLIQCDAQYPHLYTGYLIDLNTQAVFIFGVNFFFNRRQLFSMKQWQCSLCASGKRRLFLPKTETAIA